ncbi:MAG: GNAT family N-acetyltransferase [Rikenellaceae bacterium]
MITIRPATIDDVKLIHELGFKTFTVTYKDILLPDQLTYMLEMMYAPHNIVTQMSEGHNYFLAYSDDIPCAYVSIEQQDEQLYILQKIYVLPEFHGQGIGRKMIHFAFDYVKNNCKNSSCTMELHVNRNNKAQQFYSKMGLSIARTGDFDIGNGFYMNDYIMAIELVKE